MIKEKVLDDGFKIVLIQVVSILIYDEVYINKNYMALQNKIIYKFVGVASPLPSKFIKS